MEAMLGALQRACLPATDILFVLSGEKAVRRFAPFTAAMTMVDGRAYVCAGRTCGLPMTDVLALLERVGGRPSG